MPDYTLIYCVASDKKFLMVEKHRPEWQKGKLNLPGGKIELGESVIQSAYRELAEETGLVGPQDISYMQELGTIQDKGAIVHCMWCMTSYSSKIKLHPRDEETEPVGWYEWSDVQRDKRLIPNLRIILPFMMAAVPGWAIQDSDGGADKVEHRVVVSVPGGKSHI